MIKIEQKNSLFSFYVAEFRNQFEGLFSNFVVSNHF